MRSVWPSGKEQYQVTTNWYIGSSNGNSRFFDGEIREVAIWDSALNATQAAAVYAGTTPSADYPTVVTSYTYDAAGHLLTLTDPVGNTTSYTYNYMGLVATETNEKNATRYYTYDALGRLVSKTDRNGRITTYTYDTIGRLTAENWSNTTNYFMYTYDAVGNLLYATDGQHSYSYTYDALNRPIYTTFNFDSQSAVVAYTYDLAGRRTSSSLSLNGHSDRVNQVTYDFLGNATSIRQTGSAVDEIFAEFDYNANGLMTSVKRYEVDGNNLINEIAESLYTYNANNAVTSITHKNPNGTQIVQHSYTYDSTNNIVEYLNSIDGQTSYDYDFLGQLIGADYSNQNLDDETYAYDENGNRITANGYTYTTGDNNELTSDGTWTYTYDAEGNRISKTNATNRELYTWDHRNRLTSVTKQEWDSVEQDWTTTQIVEYAYDYNNVWISKVIGTDKTIFIPENYQTTVQIDNNVTTHHYLWTPNQQDKLLADTTPNSTSWALTDHLGTIRDILGATTTHLIYDAFGNLTSGTNPLLFGYTGKPFDADTALQNNINRWYDATIGRWLSTDPIGFNGNDTNLYRYVRNCISIFLDFMGKYTVPESRQSSITLVISNFPDLAVPLPSNWELTKPLPAILSTHSYDDLEIITPPEMMPEEIFNPNPLGLNTSITINDLAIIFSDRWNSEITDSLRLFPIPTCQCVDEMRFGWNNSNAWAGMAIVVGADQNRMMTEEALWEMRKEVGKQLIISALNNNVLNATIIIHKSIEGECPSTASIMNLIPGVSYFEIIKQIIDINNAESQKDTEFYYLQEKGGILFRLHN